MATYNINVRTDQEIKAKAQKIYARPDEPQSVLPQVRRKPMYGCAKDKIWIADDFDAPLDDFKEYM